MQTGIYNTIGGPVCVTQGLFVKVAMKTMLRLKLRNIYSQYIVLLSIENIIFTGLKKIENINAFQEF